MIYNIWLKIDRYLIIIWSYYKIKRLKTIKSIKNIKLRVIFARNINYYILYRCIKQNYIIFVCILEKKGIQENTRCF